MQLILLAVLLFQFGATSSSRILAVLPHLGKSHFIFYEPLLKALAGRGHDIVVISPFPQKKPVAKYTDINVEEALPMEYVNSVPFGDAGNEDITNSLKFLMTMGLVTCEKVLAYPPVQKLIQSQEKFDLVMYEMFNTDCFIGFAHKFQAPSIALFSSPLMPWASNRFGNPDNPSYISNHFVAFSDRMNFFQRFKNAVYYIGTKLFYKLAFDIPAQKIAQKYFGENLPSLQDIAANTSLMLVNSHFSFNQVRPLVPAIVEVAGLHLQPPPKLPPDLEKFISEATHGVIYFSLGSTLRSSTIPKHMLDALLMAFSELPQKILLKWEEDVLPGKPANVKISKWFPQMAVLAHPNVKVFMNHGGLMGMLEAIYFGVPMVSIPLFGDQYHNVQHGVEKGISVKLLYPEITKESILMAVKKVLDEPRYRENAKRVSSIYHDRPQHPLDTAVYWTEYVLRHHGAPHLRSAAIDLNLFQYLLLDVLSVLAAIVIAVVCILFLVIKVTIKLCRYVTSKSGVESSPKKGKKKQKAQ